MARMKAPTKPGGITIVKPKHAKFASKWGRPPKAPGPPPGKLKTFNIRGSKRGR